MAIRQIVTALFERLSASVSAQSTGEEGEEEGAEKERKGRELSQEAGDAYLLFQVLYMYILNNCVTL